MVDNKPKPKSNPTILTTRLGKKYVLHPLADLDERALIMVKRPPMVILVEASKLKDKQMDTLSKAGPSRSKEKQVEVPPLVIHTLSPPYQSTLVNKGTVITFDDLSEDICSLPLQTMFRITELLAL